MLCCLQIYNEVIQLYIYVMYVCVCVCIFQIFFQHWLLQDIEYSSLCHTVGPYCLSVLYQAAFIIYIRQHR